MMPDATGILAQPSGLMNWLATPLAWGLMLGATGLWLLFVRRIPQQRWAGQLLAAAGLVVLLLSLPRLSDLATWSQRGEQIVFWLFAALAVGCAGAAVTARNPVYTAIWFAASLVGVSGLFLFQHAQFLGVANIVVYAGAIVVTFLFVLMLAQPEGHARYDRITWSSSVVPVSLISAVVLVGIILQCFSPPAAPPPGSGDVLGSNHMAGLGRELFARHLVAVEVVGTLLLVALVGAVAIVIQDKERRNVQRGEPQHTESPPGAAS